MNDLLYCWGSNVHGQLGTTSSVGTCPGGVGPCSTVPVPVASNDLRFTTISAGTWHTCAVSSSRLYCWGYNAFGQLGDGSTAENVAPTLGEETKIQGDPEVTAVSAGSSHTCAITGGGAYCWGSAGSGELGSTSASEDCNGFPCNTNPVQVTTTSLKAISAGENYTCGLTTSERVSCWGANGFGQLGRGAADYRPSQPDFIKSTETFVSVATGTAHACALSTRKVVSCWGLNSGGAALGRVTTGACDEIASIPCQNATPDSIVGGYLLTQVSAGTAHSCGIATTGETLCWGWNAFGQLGDATTETRAVPRRLFFVGLLKIRFTWPVDPSTLSTGFFGSCEGDQPGDPVGCYWLTNNGWRDAQPFRQHWWRDPMRSSICCYHLGADWNLGGGDDDKGDTVFAVADGKVLKVHANIQGWGNIILVLHETSLGMFTSMYAHVDWLDAAPPVEGTRVVSGQAIARVGAPPGTQAYHLHFEIREGEQSDPGPAYASSREESSPQRQIDPNAFIIAFH